MRKKILKTKKTKADRKPKQLQKTSSPRAKTSQKTLKTKEATKGFGSKIKGLARKTQKSVRGQISGRTEALKLKLSGYGIGVDDVRATAKHLEQVLKDLRSREFLKQPGIQTLVERVNRKNVESSNFEAQKMAAKIPRSGDVQKHMKATKQKKNISKNDREQDKKLRELSRQSNKQLAQTVVQAIMRRVDEVRRSLTGSAESLRRKK